MLESANSVCEHAAAVKFAKSAPRTPFDIKQACAEDLTGCHPFNLIRCMETEARPRDIFRALREVVKAGDLQRLDELEEQVDAVVGSMAELRGQLMEVQRETFIEERVQDATGGEREEAGEAEKREREARTEKDQKGALLQKLQERLEAARSRKRVREEEKREEGLQGDCETPAQQLRRLERMLVDSNVEEAQEQAAAELSSQRLVIAKGKHTEKVEQLERLTTRANHLADEAEKALEAFPEYR